LPAAEQIAILFAATSGVFDNLPPELKCEPSVAKKKLAMPCAPQRFNTAALTKQSASNHGRLFREDCLVLGVDNGYGSDVHYVFHLRTTL